MSENHFRSHFWPFRTIGHFGCPKFTFDRISEHFRSIRNALYFLLIFDKMATGGHFGCPKITFDRISDHYKSIRNFYLIFLFLTKWPPGYRQWGYRRVIIQIHKAWCQETQVVSYNLCMWIPLSFCLPGERPLFQGHWSVVSFYH